MIFRQFNRGKNRLGVPNALIGELTKTAARTLPCGWFWKSILILLSTPYGGNWKLKGKQTVALSAPGHKPRENHYGGILRVEFALFSTSSWLKRLPGPGWRVAPPDTEGKQFY